MLPISAAWFYSSPGYETALAFISVLGALFAPRALSYASERHASDDCSVSGVVTCSNLPAQTSYAQAVGSRLNYIRHAVLQMSLREMAEFLDLESGSIVEGYENGKLEVQISHLKKLEAFFSIHHHFLETGEGPIFQPFILSQESVNRYLSNGYTPLLVCCPDQRRDLLCYQVFERTQNGYTQLAIAERPGSFTSSGGGNINISYLINSLIDAGKTDSDVFIAKATRQEWHDIEARRYYSRRPFYRIGSVDRECTQLFQERFEEYSRLRASQLPKA